MQWASAQAGLLAMHAQRVEHLALLEQKNREIRRQKRALLLGRSAGAS